jgi:PST family polysaccharide transporter
MNQSWVSFLPQFIRSRLEGRGILQKAVANTGWLFADKVLRVIVGVIVLIWLARYLGPEKFGILNYSIAFVALFTRVAALGLESIVVRDVVRDPRSSNEIMGTAIGLRLGGALAAVALTIGAIFVLRPEDPLTRWMVIIIATGMIFQTFDVIDLWFQSRMQSKYTIYAKNAAFMAANIAKIGLIVIGAPLIAFAWITLAEAVIGAAGLLIVYRRTGNLLLRWSVNLSRASALLKDSWPLILSGLAVVTYMRIDQVMLGEMIGANSVGIYSAAVRLSEGWYFLPIAIATSVFPSIVATRKINEALYQERLQKLYHFMTWLAIAIAVPVTFLSRIIIDLLYGASYKGAGTVLAIHIWAAVFVFLGYASGQFLLTENYTRISFYRAFWGMIVNVILNFLLIPRYGVNGAAVATLISQFGATFGIVFIKYTRRQAIMMVKSFDPVPLLKSAIRKG